MLTKYVSSFLLVFVIVKQTMKLSVIKKILQKTQLKYNLSFVRNISYAQFLYSFYNFLRDDGAIEIIKMLESHNWNLKQFQN